VTTIPILPATSLLRETAIQLATNFHLPVIETLLPALPRLLYLTVERLELRDMTTTAGPIYVDFVGGALGYRCHHSHGYRQPLAKAIGLKHGVFPTVLDATAGLGRDGFLLAHLGCYVQLLERSPVVAALLYNGLQRAQQDPKIGPLVNKRLQLIHHDSKDWLKQLPLGQQPDVIYLDPMYPHRQTSALVKKEMRTFRDIVGDDLDAPSLLKTALAGASQRVVVKRPKWAPRLSEIQPTFCIKSKNTRFDVYSR